MLSFAPGRRAACVTDLVGRSHAQAVATAAAAATTARLAPTSASAPALLLCRRFGSSSIALAPSFSSSAHILKSSSSSSSSPNTRLSSSAGARRAYVAPPRPGDGPLMERRADRELPDVIKGRFRWSRTMPWFLLIVAGASVAIFNYQKASSPVVASTLYALRTSPRAREYLGDEIYFQQRIPWIGGEMNQLQGRIDVHFMVRGTRNSARMRFTSHRPTPRGVFETIEWSLECADGRKIDLLEDVDNADPLRGVQLVPDEYIEVEQELGLLRGAGDGGGSSSSSSAAGAPTTPFPLDEPKETRGFRQPTKK